MEKLFNGDLRYSKFDTPREDAGPTCAACVYWEAFVEGLGGFAGGGSDGHVVLLRVIMRSVAATARADSDAAYKAVSEHRSAVEARATREVHAAFEHDRIAVRVDLAAEPRSGFDCCPGATVRFE